jgi:hypothetical protein
VAKSEQGRQRSFRGHTDDGDEAEAQQQTKDRTDITTAKIEGSVAPMKGQGVVDSVEAVAAGDGALGRLGARGTGICGSGTLGR